MRKINTPAKLTCKCPYCGKGFKSQDLVPDGLLPMHPWPRKKLQQCLGSKQYPVGLLDPEIQEVVT